MQQIDFKFEYVDSCPICGEDAIFREGDFLLIECTECNFAGSFESVEDYIEWSVRYEARLRDRKKEQSKKKAKMLLDRDDKPTKQDHRTRDRSRR